MWRYGGDARGQHPRNIARRAARAAREGRGVVGLTPVVDHRPAQTAFEGRLRRLGEMMEEQRQTIGMNEGAKGNPGGQGAKIERGFKNPAQPTLTEAGIDKNLAKRARATAAVPAQEFERLLSEWRTDMEKARTPYLSLFRKKYTPKKLIRLSQARGSPLRCSRWSKPATREGDLALPDPRSLTILALPPSAHRRRGALHKRLCMAQYGPGKSAASPQNLKPRSFGRPTGKRQSFA